MPEPKHSILFITTAFPPHPESQTVRNAYLIRGLLSAGHKVIVITKPTTSKQDTSINHLVEDTEVFRTEASSYDKQQNRLKELPISSLTTWLHGIWTNLVTIPDPHKNWDKQVIKLYQDLLSKRSFDAIISSSGSYTAHLAGSTISRLTKTPLILELGDPWAHNPIWPASLRYRRTRNAKLESKCLNTSSKIVVTTKETRESYWTHYEYPKPRISVVPMGFEKKDFIEAKKNLKKDSRNTILTYAGVAYKSGRNLIPTFDGMHLSRIPSLTLNVYGQYSSSFTKHCAKNNYNFVNFGGHISFLDSITKLIEADILLLVGNRGGVQIPGKVYMYLATHTPILYLSQAETEKDPTWQLLKAFPGIVRCENHADSISSALDTITKDFQKLREASLTRSTHIFEWEEIGNSFCQCVKNLILEKSDRTSR